MLPPGRGIAGRGRTEFGEQLAASFTDRLIRPLIMSYCVRMGSVDHNHDQSLSQKCGGKQSGPGRRVKQIFYVNAYCYSYIYTVRRPCSHFA